MDVINYFFAWYTGQIWSIMFGALITSLIVRAFLISKLVRIHRQHQAQMHNHITQEFNKLKKELAK